MSNSEQLPPNPLSFLPSPELMQKFAEGLAWMRNNSPVCRQRRSTLTGMNTIQFLPWIQKLLADPASGLVIPRAEFKSCKLQTLYLKWMGAIQYLVENKDVPPEQRQAAALIKTQYVARKDEVGDCLRIEPRTGSERTNKGAQKKALEIVGELKRATPTIEWREEFLEWAAGGEVGVPWIKKGLALTAEDVAFVRSLCDENGWECVVDYNTIKVMKL